MCDPVLIYIDGSAAPIAPRHAASRYADRHARCAAFRIVCIGYHNAPLLLQTAKARTLCVYLTTLEQPEGHKSYANALAKSKISCMYSIFNLLSGYIKLYSIVVCSRAPILHIIANLAVYTVQSLKYLCL